MADAPEIKVKLTAEDTGVSAAIKELGANLKNLKKTQDETAASGFTLAKAFESIAAAGALLGLAKIGKDAFDSANNIGKLSDKTGISTQTLSVFHKVAGDVGASTEAVDKSLIKAAKSITDFQQGGQRAAGGFAILNLRAKDFAGLNADQKLQLVTSRLGGMAASFQKAAATQAIFGKGASDLTLVANSLAAQGFDKASAATAKLGLLMDQSTTDAFRSAKASMQELTDVGKGMATQFEAGLLPAISDVSDALIESLTQGGVNFQQLGKYAGDVVRGIALIFLGLGQTLGTVAASISDIFTKAWDLVKNEAETDFKALGQAAHGHIADAFGTLESGAQKSTSIVSDEVERQKGIYKSLGDSFKADYANLFPSDAEEARRNKERVSRLRPDKQIDAPEPKPPAAPEDAAAKAALALLEKQLQDEITLRRAKAQQAEEIDKEEYDRGEISLTEYYARRRAQVAAEAKDEIAILQQGLVGAQAEVARAAQAKATAATPKDADKEEGARLRALAQVDELQTKIAEKQITSQTEITKLDDDQQKKKDANQQAILEFEQKIDTSGKARLAAAQLEIQAETQKLAIILRQSGESEAQVQAELQRYATARTQEVQFQDEQKQGGAQLQQLDAQKAEIQDKVKSGQLFQVQADEQIRAAEQARLPVLQQIADKLKEQAALSGNAEDKAAADQFQKNVDQIAVSSSLADQQMATLKSTLQGALTQGFTQFFETVGRGTESVATSFEKLAGSIISSLARMAAQMLAQIIIAKLLKAALSGTGFSGGGSVSVGGAGGGFAEGGLIKGPGGPKADSIPARLSDGEFVVQAGAVKQFGAHNLEAINRGLKPPSFDNLQLPKFAEGGLVGAVGASGASGDIRLGIGLDKGLILQHLSSKDAGRIVLDHIANNPKGASKALGRSQG